MLLKYLLEDFLDLLDRIPDGLIALIARWSIGAVFLQSGRTKLDGWQISENAIYLFREEYKLPLLDPVLAAYAAAFAEHFFPLLLIFGFASRLAALGLIGMTLVIQCFVYPDAWATHGTWIAGLLLIAANGPGAFSIDHWLYGKPPRSAS